MQYIIQGKKQRILDKANLMNEEDGQKKLQGFLFELKSLVHAYRLVGFRFFFTFFLMKSLFHFSCDTRFSSMTITAITSCKPLEEPK